jgi:hypothetical protein
LSVEYAKEDRPAELKKFRTSDPQERARTLVRDIHYPDLADLSEVYVVWFCSALDNWKALVSTNVKDNRYYEVTHNGAKSETYVDDYVKKGHSRVSD